MTYFERYFERLDGDDPYSSLEVVAPDVEFSIQWAAGGDRRSSQFVGGLEQLRGFIGAGDMEGWAHHVLFSGTDGDVEFALGRYMVARSPSMVFPTGAPDARPA